MFENDYPDDWETLSSENKKRNPKCKKCGRRIKGKMHSHHIISLSEGGKNTLSNLITLCEECHKNYNLGHMRKTKRMTRNKKSFMNRKFRKQVGK